MLEESRRITPTLLTPPASASAAVSPSEAPHRSPFAALSARAWWVIGVSVTLALAVLLTTGRAPNTPRPPPSTAAELAPASAPSDPILSPAALAAARLDAQNALAKVLSASDALAAQRVSEWDAAGWADSQHAVAQGELAYREQRYPAAIRLYAGALTSLNKLAQRLPALIAAATLEGEQALARGDAVGATRAFTRVLAASPAEPKATGGLVRAQHYDQVQALLAEAAGYEHLNDPAKARASYAAALALDPATILATQGLARLDAGAQAETYAAAMSQGYAALTDQRFDMARAAFTKAAQLRPTAEDAQRALATTAQLASAAKFSAYLSSAARHESSERWADALSALNAAIRLDPDVEGLSARREHARSRAALARRLQDALQNPVQLRVPATAAAAELTLLDARRIPTPGPKLRAQIQQLSAALKKSREPLLESER